VIDPAKQPRARKRYALEHSRSFGPAILRDTETEFEELYGQSFPSSDPSDLHEWRHGTTTVRRSWHTRNTTVNALPVASESVEIGPWRDAAAAGAITPSKHRETGLRPFSGPGHCLLIDASVIVRSTVRRPSIESAHRLITVDPAALTDSSTVRRPPAAFDCSIRATVAASMPATSGSASRIWRASPKYWNRALMTAAGRSVWCVSFIPVPFRALKWRDGGETACGNPTNKTRCVDRREPV
jgi:hypothetical protein